MTPPRATDALARYALATIGPILGAGAQFVLSIVVLRLLSAGDFGRFSFLLIASQLGLGLWGALFCAPLPALAREDDGEGATHAMTATCLAMTVVAFAAFTALGFAVGVGALAAFGFALFSAVSLLRWFGRARAFVARAPSRAIASDLTYAIVVLVGTTVAWLTRAASLETTAALLATGIVAALLPLGGEFLRDQFLRVRWRDIAGYAPIWRRHGGWAVIGVLTTEATANAHVYAVTIVYGPSAYAAIAAAALIVRPVTVAQNALGEFERPRIAREIDAGDFAAVDRSVTWFRIALGAAWAATGLAAAALFLTDPRLLFPPHYDLRYLAIAGALWLAVALVRLLRTPDSILLQAAGAFRDLAHASIVSSVWSIAAVALTLVLAGPLWSIGGIAIGELVFALWIWRQARRWRASCRASGGDAVTTVV